MLVEKTPARHPPPELRDAIRTKKYGKTWDFFHVGAYPNTHPSINRNFHFFVTFGHFVTFPPVKKPSKNMEVGFGRPPTPVLSKFPRFPVFSF